MEPLRAAEIRVGEAGLGKAVRIRFALPRLEESFKFELDIGLAGCAFICYEELQGFHVSYLYGPFDPVIKEWQSMHFEHVVCPTPQERALVQRPLRSCLLSDVYEDVDGDLD